MVFEFDRCAEDDSVVHGLLRLSGMTFIESSDGRSGSEAATAGFENLAITSGGATETAHGGFAMKWAWDDNADSYDLTLSGQSFMVTDSSGVSELTSFSFREVGEGPSYRFTVSGNAHDATGSLTLSTPTALTGRFGNYPEAGSLLVAAPDNSRLTLTALSTTTVQLDVDTNGDGQADSSEQLSWDELDALADQNQ